MSLDKISTSTPGTDEWWLQKLMKQMNARPVRSNPRTSDSRRDKYTRAEWLDLLWAYHQNEPPLTNYDSQWADTTYEVLRLAKTGYAGLLSTSLLERVRFVGVRVISTVPDAVGDEKVRRILSANGQALSDALEFSAVMGTGYISVSPGGEEGALLSAEDPRGMIDSTDPVTGDVRAVLKLYFDEDYEQYVAALYIADPDDPTNYRTSTFVRSTSANSTYKGGYFNLLEWDRAPDMDAPVIPGRGIPIVPFVNKSARGEAENHLDLLDRIYNGIADRLWLLKHLAYKQRAIEAVSEEDLEDEDGNKLDVDSIFSGDPGALWVLPEGAKIHEFSAANVQEALLPVRDDVKELSSTSQVPIPTVMGEQVNGTATGADLTREGINNRARDRIARWSPQVIKVAKLGMLFSGEPVPDELEAMAEPVERITSGQIAQMAVAAQVPTEAVWMDILQQSPETVARWTALKDQERLMNTPLPSAINSAPANFGGVTDG